MYCEARYKEIISKRPDLLTQNDLVSKILVEEWEKMPPDQKLNLKMESIPNGIPL